MTEQQWIAPKEAAPMLGYSTDYFTRYVMRSLVYRDIPGPRGGHRYLILLASVEEEIERQTRVPA